MAGRPGAPSCCGRWLRAPAYSDAQMGLANAMAYFSILLSILFTVYFFRKLAAARTQIGAEW